MMCSTYFPVFFCFCIDGIEIVSPSFQLFYLFLCCGGYTVDTYIIIYNMFIFTHIHVYAFLYLKYTHVVNIFFIS